MNLHATRSQRLAGLLAAAALALGAALWLTTDTADARNATAAERTGVLRTWSMFTARQAGRAEPRRCNRTWVIRVSPHRPRLASMFPRQLLRERLRCPIGDGWILLQRRTPRMQAWRIRMMGSGIAPPCRLMPPRASRQLGFRGDCSR